MVAKKKTQNLEASAPASPSPAALFPSSRNLGKAHLAGVVFGCTNSTIKECLAKQLFGLPAQHFSYVKNIDPGLTLFLFNYSTRALHGIFEAASPGQMYIDPYGWTDGSQRTSYPAQVQVHVRKNCHPLVENQFKLIIKENYYTYNHFRFELDHAQVSKLISLLSNQVVTVAPSSSTLKNTGKYQMITHHPSQLKIREAEGSNPSAAHVNYISCNQSNGHLSHSGPSSCSDNVHQSPGAAEEMEKDERNRIYEKLQDLASNRETSGSSPASQVEDSASGDKMQSKFDDSQRTGMLHEGNFKNSPLDPSDFPTIIAQLMQEVRELKAFKEEHTQKMSQLEQKLAKSESEVQLLKDHRMRQDYLCNHPEAYTYGTIVESCSEQLLDPDDVIFLVGGFDGQSWLSSLDSYSPSKDVIKSSKPMSSVRPYASVSKLNGDLYVIGGGPGGNGTTWYDTVESYSFVNENWTSHPSLNRKKGSLAATTLHDKIFAVGGGNGIDCFSDVEMFDLDVGRWISARSMQQKRFALAVVELNGALYAVGGFDGNEYLRSAERFDPREHSWSRLESMNSKRGSHSLVVLNEKLYAIGGFDGSRMVPSVEVLDPRYGTWMLETPMNHARGYSAAAVLSNTLYVIGGMQENEKIVEKVERFEEGCGWQQTNLKAVGKRCFASALVL